MLDKTLRPVLDPPLKRLAAPLAALRVPADLVTFAGLVAGLAAAGFLAAGWFCTALGLFLLSRLLDGLDGPLARASRPTSLGGYLDILADFTVYAALPLGFALALPAPAALMAALLLASFYINAASFLGLAILAERVRLRSKANGPKSHYHPRGLIEGAETIAFFSLCLLQPSWFVWLAPVLAALTLWTAFARLFAARRIAGLLD